MKMNIIGIVLLVSITIQAQPIRSVMAAESIGKIEEANDIKEVEWLQSTGTQYILVNSSIDGFDGFILPENNNTFGAVGVWNGGARSDTIKWTSVRDRGWCFLNGDNLGIYTFDMTYDLSHVIVNGTSCFVNGTYYQMGSTWGVYFSQYQYFALFGCYHRDGYVSTQSCKIGRCKLYYKGELLYDFTPIRYKNEDNIWEGAMYDNVNGEMFRNQGTGGFIFGRDI